jgi:hypothetical protein
MVHMRIHTGLLAALLCLAAGSARATSVDELVAKNIEARGGLAHLQALKSLRTTGKLKMGNGNFSMEMAYTELIQRGGFYREEVTVQGLTAIEAYDGKDGWKVQPFEGRKDAEKVSADAAKSYAQQADLEGPLVDWARKGHKVEYLGTEDVDGTEAHKLKVTLKDGDVEYRYLDPDHFLEIRIVHQSKVRGVEHETETDLGNYEQVAGVYVPFSLETGRKGAPKGMKVVVEKVEANVPMDEALFHFPTPAPKTAAAPQP